MNMGQIIQAGDTEMYDLYTGVKQIINKQI